MQYYKLKELSYSIAAIAGLFVLLDYFITGLGFHESFFTDHRYLGFFNVFPGKYGIVIRSFYLFAFATLCYYGHSYKIVKNRAIYSYEGKVLLAILSTVFSLQYIFIIVLPVYILPFVYPAVFILASTAIIFTIISFSIKQREITEKKLGAEGNRNTGDLGFSLPSEDGYVNIPNPFRGILVVGGAGAGKSASVAEPLIYQAIEKGYSGLLYDFKFTDFENNLTNVAYSAFKKYGVGDVNFKVINFTHLDKSYRCNPIHPDNMPMVAYADEYAQVIFNNLFKDTSAGTKDAFFSMSAKQLLKAAIWYLKTEHPQYCTVPHTINLILEAGTKQLINMLESNEETRGMVSAVKVAERSGAGEQLAGVLGQLKMVIERINTKEIAWVLTGNDVSFDLNDRENPTFLCIGSNPMLNDSLSPVIALIITVCLKLLNMPGKRHSIVMLDEFPTLYIPNIEFTPATGRSNKVALIAMCQDFSQMVDKYGQTKTDAIVSNLGNQLFGNMSHPKSLKYVSDLFGREEKIMLNQGQSSSDSTGSHSRSKSLNYITQERNILKSQEIIEFEPGRFAGKVVETENTFFNTRLKRIQDQVGDYKVEKLPSFTSGYDVDRNFIQIKMDVREILRQYSTDEQSISLVEV